MSKKAPPLYRVYLRQDCLKKEPNRLFLEIGHQTFQIVMDIDPEEHNQPGATTPEYMAQWHKDQLTHAIVRLVVETRARERAKVEE